jgi:hypothetical protein
MVVQILIQVQIQMDKILLQIQIKNEYINKINNDYFLCYSI